MARKALTNGDLLGIATMAAHAAAAFVRDADRPRNEGWSRKGLNDFVTAIDREAERIVTEHLTAAVPGSVVRGEELSPDTPTGGLAWIVDPLDGTTNYLHGYPAYAVSIAATVDNVLRAGVVVDIPHRRTYTAATGEGAWCDGDTLRVSTIDVPSLALLGTGFPFKAPEDLPRYLEQFRRLLHVTSGIRRAGAAALDLVDVAQGRFDGFWETRLAPWDVAAGALIVREAGGIVTDASGSPDIVRHGSIVAGNRDIHRWLLAALKEIPEP